MTQSFAAGQLKTIIGRIERLEEDKATIAGDIKGVYAEAKGNGFDVKVIHTIVARRKLEAADLAEADAMLELYEQALGMAPSEEEEE